MKIAVCFSGQIRTGVEASENIKRFLGDLLPYCDFFIHTWNINSYPFYCGDSVIKNDDELISDDVIIKIVDIYQPKDIEVEDYNNLKEKDNKILDPIISLWYSFYKSVQLKKRYEKDNNFEYDYVVKLRFDIIFPSDRKLNEDYSLLVDNSIYIENLFTPNELCIEDIKLNFIDDVYYIGVNKSMNEFSDYYNNIKYINDTNGYLILEYLDKLKIKYDINQYKYFNNKHGRYSIYRKECLKYSPILDFYKCKNCDFYYYVSIYNINSIFSGGYIFELNRKYEIDNLYDLYKNYYISELKEREGYEDRSMF